MAAHHLWQVSLSLACLVPTALIAATLFVSRHAPFRAASLVTPVTVVLSALAVAVRAVFALVRPDAGPVVVGSRMLGRVQLGLVSSTMLLLVCTLAVVVVRYSRSYLAGEPGLDRYVRSLLLTLASVTLLVISNHLGVVVAAWLATGIGLHQLLTFYRNRRQAVIVAHKEFLLSRLADVCFFASVVLIDSEIGSLRIDVINAYALAHGALSPPLHLATVLLVFGVLLKSAQIPFHGWMQQVMEAPTPVSALLHAGIVNIGGFVMIRLAPLMAHAPMAQGILVTVGLLTAMLGSLVMTTRASIKVTLAWSTVAQMGFMLVQCGLGVWHLALLHLLAHSLYKAHAFLSTGSVVDAWRGASLVRASRPSLRRMAVVLAMLGVAALPFYAAFTLSSLRAKPSLGPLALALGLSFVPMLSRALAAGRRAFARAWLFTLGAAASYFALHAIFEAAAPAIDAAPPMAADSSPGWSVVVAGLIVLFVAQTVLQTSSSGRFARFLQPHLNSGLYIDEWFTRMTFRLWPPRLERSAATSRRSIAGVSREAR